MDGDIRGELSDVVASEDVESNSGEGCWLRLINELRGAGQLKEILTTIIENR